MLWRLGWVEVVEEEVDVVEVRGEWRLMLWSLGWVEVEVVVVEVRGEWRWWRRLMSSRLGWVEVVEEADVVEV